MVMWSEKPQLIIFPECAVPLGKGALDTPLLYW